VEGHRYQAPGLGHVGGAVARLAARCALTVHAGKAGASPRLRWEGPLAAWGLPCACPLPSPRSTPRPDCTRLASSPARVLTCNALHCCSIWQGRVGQRLRSEGEGRVQRAGQQHITERGGGAARPRGEAHLALWEGGGRQGRRECEEKEERSALEDAVSALYSGLLSVARRPRQNVQTLRASRHLKRPPFLEFLSPLGSGGPAELPPWAGCYRSSSADGCMGPPPPATQKLHYADARETQGHHRNHGTTPTIKAKLGKHRRNGRKVSKEPGVGKACVRRCVRVRAAVRTGAYDMCAAPSAPPATS